MVEEENGYELVNNNIMASFSTEGESNELSSAEDIAMTNQTGVAGEEGDVVATGDDSLVKESLFGATEQLIRIDPNRKGPRDWFSGCNPELVHLLFWESGRKSGGVFVGVLTLLLSFASFSLVSLLAYCTLALLATSTAFTLYRRIHGSISKKGANNSISKDSHPLRALLELDLTVKPSRLASLLEPLCDPFNRFLIKARAILLIQNVLDSAKFGVLMWLMTYIGACFNALSLLMLTWVAFFTVPVLYEKNQQVVDSVVCELSRKGRETVGEFWASALQPKIHSTLQKMPPAVRNALSQVMGTPAKAQQKAE